MSAPMEALHEIRRLANEPTVTARCWRCQGRGFTFIRVPNGETLERVERACPSCGGSGEPERVTPANPLDCYGE